MSIKTFSFSDPPAAFLPRINDTATSVDLDGPELIEAIGLRRKLRGRASGILSDPETPRKFEFTFLERSDYQPSYDEKLSRYRFK